MSFGELDKFLTQQADLVADAGKRAISGIENDRAEAQPLVQGCVETLDEYYKKILKPRTDLHVVIKKMEKPNIDPKHPYDPHYHYIVNFIPEDLPDRYRSFADQYADPNRIGFNDWHPNVALQFGLKLEDKYSQKAQGVIGLKAEIYLRAWGTVEAGDRMVMPKDVNFGYGNGWEKTYTTFNINGEIGNPKTTVGNLVTVLTAITPEVLAHKKTIRGH